MPDQEQNKSSAYVWFDAEFTSLDLEQARLLQVAAIVTDTNLNRVAPPEADLNLCIRLEEGEVVSPWVAENLPGLVEKCRSEEAVSVGEADRRLSHKLLRGLRDDGFPQENYAYLNTIARSLFAMKSQ